MTIIEQSDTDIFANLALEEALMERAAAEGPFLLLWRARDAVVIGKNQNPWAECAVERLPALKIGLARRLSGGGAVFHDAGNLNYAWITERNAYAPEKVYEAVLSGLGALGIAATRTDNSNLRVRGLKISGNAFALRRGAAMHHGTLLVRANLDRLRSALAVDPAPYSGRAIPSRRDRVVNLSAIDASLTVERIQEALVEAFGKTFESPVQRRCAGEVSDETDRAARRARLASWAWVYGLTPTFDYTPPERPGVSVRVKEGRVSAFHGQGPHDDLARYKKGDVFAPL